VDGQHGDTVGTQSSRLAEDGGDRAWSDDRDREVGGTTSFVIVDAHAGGPDLSLERG